MAFTENIKTAVNDYVRAHLGDEKWHEDYFDFITDRDLAKRLGEEFISTRYVYKLLEAMEADGWLLRAQVRIQVISYASIYEAAIHHILFNDLKASSKVKELMEFKAKKLISIPEESRKQLEKHLEHDGKIIIPTYETIGTTSESKIRFDKKAECACRLGLIDEELMNDIVELYEARNAIHIHAEIRKNLEYQIELSKKAYRRLKPFSEQIRSKLKELDTSIPK